jgi:hypothetical protein
VRARLCGVPGLYRPQDRRPGPAGQDRRRVVHAVPRRPQARGHQLRGLKVQGAHIGHCGECEIRKCGLPRKVKNCALCSDYPCETIGKFLANVPPAKANLEEVRRARQT